MSEQTVEDLAFLVDEEVLQGHLLLLLEELLHDFEEVAAKD